jgi:hypothetical protein
MAVYMTMTRKNWHSYSRIVTVGLLAGLVGLILPGCASLATSSTGQSTQDKNNLNINTSNTNTPSEETRISKNNSNKIYEAVAFQENPKNASTTQQIASFTDDNKLPFIGTRAFNFLGGSGTGQTITIEANGNTTIKLHGTASSSVLYSGKFSNPIMGLLIKGNKIYRLGSDGQSCNPQEGLPCETSLYEVSPPAEDNQIKQQNVSKSGDNQFKEQNFSRALFEQVIQLIRDCGRQAKCNFQQYNFKDAVLTTQRNGTESATNTLTPNQPISRQQALVYSGILTFREKNELDLTRAELQPGKIIYRGCPYDAGGSKPVSLCKAELNTTSDGKISKITVTVTWD